MSFTIAWTDPGRHIVAAEGSENLFFNQAKKSIFSSLKVAAIYDSMNLPVSYAWLETGAYGKTTGFSPSKAEVAGSFLAVKFSDPKTAVIPAEMALTGFTLGVTFEGRSVDSVVEVPPSDQATTDKLEDCMRKLTERMEAALKH